VAIVRTLIEQALRICRGVKRAGQGANDSELNEGLYVGNAILDAWRTNRRTAYSTPRLAVPLSSGVQQYTIGPGATINIPWPPWLELASIILNGIEIPIEVYHDAEQWQRVQLKSLGNTIPSTIYYDRAFPVGNLFLWPIPYSGLSLVLYPWQQLAEFGALTDPLNLPPAFRQALLYSIAEELIPRLGFPERADVVRFARRYRAAANTLNTVPPRMSADYGLLAGRPQLGGGSSWPVILGGNSSGGGSATVQWIPSLETPDGIRTTFSFAQPPVYISYNGLNQFLGVGYRMVGSSQVEVTIRDVDGNLIIPGVGDSIMAEVL